VTPAHPVAPTTDDLLAQETLRESVRERYRAVIGRPTEVAAQLYLPEEIAIFRRLGKVLFAVADSRQKIYTSVDCMAALEAAAGNNIHKLKYHYRNGRKICLVADTLARDNEDYEPLGSSSNYDEVAKPSTVEHYMCPDIAAQCAKMIATLETQVKAYPDELLGVLCPRKEQLAEVWALVKDSSIGHLAVLQKSGDYVPFDPERPICVCTIHGAKGLEFRVVHVLACETLKRFRLQRNITFTAVTRAKTSLTMYYSGDIAGYLEGALASIDPEPELPEIPDVFKPTTKRKH
jgi:DNA helicase IV